LNTFCIQLNCDLISRLPANRKHH